MLAISTINSNILIAVIGAIAVLFGGAVTGLVNRRLSRMEVKQEQINTATAQINRAVNHVAPGEPTLIQRVKRNEVEMTNFRDWIQLALSGMSYQIGVTLPKYPAPAPHEDSGAATAEFAANEPNFVPSPAATNEPPESDISHLE